MKDLRLLILTIAASGSLAACGANPGSPIAPTHPAPLAQNVLQFAAGTANLYGTATGLNVVATYRQGAGSYAVGDSGALLDSVTLSLPAAVGMPAGTPSGYDSYSTVLTGPGAADAGSAQLSSSAQLNPSTTTTTFGQSGGVFGIGIEPFNEYGPQNAPSANLAGTPFQTAPYPIPLFATTATAANVLTPWGGPPAFNITGSGGVSVVGNGNYPGGTAGVSEGIDVFQGVAATAGAQYKLAVSIPANTGTVSSSQTFTMPAALTTIATPVNPTFVPDGNGGGSFAPWALPAGATEAYVQVVDFGPVAQAGTQPASCNGASTNTPVYYTLQTNGATLGTLADAIGPGAAPSICSAAANNALSANSGLTTPAGGDQVVVQVIALDYPLYEASYPKSLGNASPTILGPNKSDDIAVSAATCSYDSGGGTQASCAASLPLLRKHSAGAALVLHRH